MSQRIRGYAVKNNDDTNAISSGAPIIIYCRSAMKFLEGKRDRERKREWRFFDSRANILNVIENNTFQTESKI